MTLKETDDVLTATIWAFQPPPANERHEKLAAWQRVVGHLNYDVFEKACAKALQKPRGSRGWVQPGDVCEIANAIIESANLGPQGHTETRKCTVEGCDGRFLWGYVRRKLDGRIYEAVTPCRGCNSLAADARPTDAFRQQFEPSTRDAYLAQRQKASDEYAAREASRRRELPKVVEVSEYKISEAVKVEVERKTVAPVEPKRLAKVVEEWVEYVPK